MSGAEVDHVRAHPGIPGGEALLSLLAGGHVDGVQPPCPIAPGVILELTGGHSPAIRSSGSVTVRCSSDTWPSTPSR